MIKIHTTQSLPYKYRVLNPIQKKEINFQFMTVDFNKSPSTLLFDDFTDLSNIVEDGYSFLGCTFDGNKNDDNIDSVSLFVIDFDKDINIEEFDKRCERMFLIPNLIYKSISYTTELEKFRVVFKLNKTITDKEEIIKYQKSIEVFIKLIFPEADPKSFSISQFWLGSSKESTIRIDNNSFFDFLSIDFYIINYFESIYGKHYKRKIESLLKVIELKDSKIYKKIEQSLIGGVLGKITGSLTLTKASLKRSQNDDIISKNPNKNDNSNKNNLKIEEQKNQLLSCNLIAEFVNDSRKLTHWELFHLANSYYNISGGEDEFINILSKSGIYNNMKIAEMKSHFKYLRKKNFNGPTPCALNCPYFDSCPKNSKIEPNLHNPLHILNKGKGQTKIKNVNSNNNIIKKSLEDVRVELLNTMDDVYFNQPDGIYVIKSGCGTGKSYWNKNTNLVDTLICVPTLNILDEYRPYQFGTVNRCPQLDPIFENKIKQLDEKNLKGRMSLLRTAVDSYYKKGNFVKVNELKAHIDQINNVYKEDTIATTHASFFNNIEKYKQHTIIIDEDPIDSMLKIKSVKLSDFTKIINKIEKNELLNKKYLQVKLTLKKIKSQKENKINYFNILKNVPEEIWDACFKELSYLYDSPMISLKNHKYYIKTDNGNILFCEERAELPVNKKIIIQSATIDEKMAKLLYGPNIKFIEIIAPELKGRIYQDGDYSYSRASVKDQLINNNKINEKIENIKSRCNIDYMISFLGNKDDFEDYELDFLNFGSQTGINKYNGLNGLVIGNPYPNPERVKLIGSTLLNKKMIKCDFKFFEVRRGNTIGKLNLFTDDTLQTIQINFIETEVVQSIGRSRLYEEDCEMYLLSSFPVDGSIVESF